MQEEIEILIIEDEELWSQSLSANLNDFGYSVTGIADNFEDAVVALNQKNYDIVLLDININGRNSGLELGRMIHTLYQKPFIFITASHGSHTLDQAVASHPSAYLSKPVNPASLVITIQSAINNFDNKTSALETVPEEDYQFFFVKQGNKYKKINWKDVVCLRSEKKYTSILNAADKTEYFIRSTLPRTLQYIIPKQFRDKFIQVNRAEVLQSGFIQGVNGDEVETAHGVFAMTDSYSKDLRKVLNLLG